MKQEMIEQGRTSNFVGYTLRMEKNEDFGTYYS